MADGFTQLTGYLAQEMAKLSPAHRRRINRKIGMAIRKANAKRIANNVEPDSSGMTPRKQRRGSARNGAGKRGRMFRKMRLARSFKVKPTANGVSVGFEGAVGQTARAHHYGLHDFVRKTNGGRTVRTKYAKRELLGFAPEDLDMISETVFSLFE